MGNLPFPGTDWAVVSTAKSIVSVRGKLFMYYKLFFWCLFSCNNKNIRGWAIWPFYLDVGVLSKWVVRQHQIPGTLGTPWENYLTITAFTPAPEITASVRVYVRLLISLTFEIMMIYSHFRNQKGACSLVASKGMGISVGDGFQQGSSLPG